MGRVGVGVRLGGWTLEGFNPWTPQKGESLSEAFAAVRVRLLSEQPLVASLEGGWLSYTVNDPAAVMREGDGLGWRLGLAWDVRVARAWVVSPSLVGSWGMIHPDSSLQPSFSYWSMGAVLRLEWLW